MAESDVFMIAKQVGASILLNKEFIENITRLITIDSTILHKENIHFY